MKREQAVEINDHLVDACEALDQAQIAIAGLGKAERLKLDDLLHEIVLDLHEKLLPRFTNSTRTWCRQKSMENRAQ
jgi:hypothetical protein